MLRHLLEVVEGVAGTAEDVLVLGNVEVLKGVTSGAEVLAGVEFSGLLVEDLTDGSSLRGDNRKGGG